MTTFRTSIKQYPVLSYFTLTFGISWGGMLLIIVGHGRIPSTPEEIASIFPMAYLTTVAGPSLAALLLTGLVGGRAAFRELAARLVKWRVGIRWYAVAFLAAPLSVNATLLALSRVSSAFLPGFVNTTDGASGVIPMSLGVVIALSLFNGFVEELGWTGFAIPRMYRQYGVFTTGLTVGFLWGAWHFASNMALSSGSSAPVPFALFMAVLLFSFLPPFRMLMVWVYDHTESLLVAMLMHASLDAFWLIATPPGMTPVSLVVWYLAWAALLWVVVTVVAVINHSQFSRLSKPPASLGAPQITSR